jgi:hypothetical protein
VNAVLNQLLLLHRQVSDKLRQKTIQSHGVPTKGWEVQSSKNYNKILGVRRGMVVVVVEG